MLPAKIELIATAAFGLEALVAKELRHLGYTELKTENGRVTFTADLAAIGRTNLWLRTAERVLIKMGEFRATSFTELFDQTRALPWTDWLPADANFPVNGKSIQSKLFSVPDCQAIVKKAVVEAMKDKYGGTWFGETGPRYTIEVGLLRDVATLTIDTSGVGLHKRGYRKLVGEAPLRETLAAAIINLSGWRPERALVDPLCGSGTIPIEAALIGTNTAPGLGRTFAAEAWPVVPPPLWLSAREEAKDKRWGDVSFRALGSDIDGEAISLARFHAEAAGVTDFVGFQKLPVAELRSRQRFGYILCNPPYGERMGEEAEVARLYREMGQVFRTLDTWSVYVLSAHPEFERYFGRNADKKRKLYNGRLQCNLYQYFGPRPPRRVGLDGSENDSATKEEISND